MQIVESKVDVSVYFKPAVTEEQVLAVKDELKTLPFVKNVEYVTKSEALTKLREQYKDSPLILESLKELDNNPLGDTLVVNTYDTESYQKVIDAVLANSKFASLIDGQSFDDNSYIIEKLQKITNRISRIGWGVTAFFAIISVMVIVNTIRIAIYTHKDEIAIMRLVGASNRFIRGPFVFESIIYAFIGSLICFGLSYLFAVFSDPYVIEILGQSDFSILGYLFDNMLYIFGGELLGIMIISIVATSLATRRYLKV